MKNKNLWKYLLLSTFIVTALNSCLVATVASTGIGLAVEAVKLPFKIIGGIVGIINGDSRNNERKKAGSNYEKSINKVLESDRKDYVLENFKIYLFETLTFEKKDGKIMQLVDKKSNIKFPFTIAVEKYSSPTEIENKINEFESSNNITKINSKTYEGMTKTVYETRINNKEKKVIENYKVVLIQVENELLTYQYLISNDETFNLEERLFEDVINNTFTK